jgi:hypothetical protein
LWRAAAACGATLCVGLGAPFALVVALVWIDAAIGSAYRPAQAALLPAVVRTPVQLTAAVTSTSNAKGRAQVLGALGGSVLVAAASSATALLVATALNLVAALQTAAITSTAPAPRGSGVRVLAGGVAALGRNIEASRIAAWSSVRSLLRAKDSARCSLPPLPGWSACEGR